MAGPLDDPLSFGLLVGSAVVLVAVVAVRFSTRLGVPTLLLYLAIGLVLGNAISGLNFHNPDIAESIGLGSLVIILAEGGLSTRLSDVKPVLPLAIVLATVGVAVSAAVTALFVHLIIDAGWRQSFLYGAVLAPTDAAAVFATLRRIRIAPRLVSILEAESGTNDPLAVIAVTLLVGTGSVGPTLGSPLLSGLVAVPYQLVVGAVLGGVVGFLGALGLRRAALSASGIFPLGVLGLCVLAYGAASVISASGFVAVYVAGVWLGNADLPHRPATRSFAQGMGWLAQVGVFVVLGALAIPDRLASAVLPALAIGGALLMLARPAAVLVSALPFRLRRGAQRLRLRSAAILSWAGLRGAVPIVLATIALAAHRHGSERLFDVVFVLVVIFTIIQSPSLGPMARLLRVAAPAEPMDLEVETAPLGEVNADLLQVRVPRDSKLRGVELRELRMPAGANATLVVRDGASFVPDAGTRLAVGDQVLLVASDAARREAVGRLRAVNRAGKLAGWRGEEGAEET
jgi:cell volume regulation protein A